MNKILNKLNQKIAPSLITIDGRIISARQINFNILPLHIFLILGIIISLIILILE